MKKTLLLFTICLISSGAFSQVAAIDETATPFLFEINNDLYVVTDYLSGGGSPCRYNNNAVLKSRSSSNMGHITHAIKTNDNKLLYVGNNSDCDVVMPYQDNFICKVDTNLHQLFMTTYTLSHGQKPKAVLQYSDSSYFSFTDSFLIKHDKNGQFITKMNTGLSNVSSAILVQNGNILVSAKQGGTTLLVELSSSGAVVSTKVFPVLLSKLSFYDGQKIMGLGVDKKLYKISAALDLINTSSFSQGKLVNDFIYKSDSVYCILTSSMIQSEYTIVDTSFTTLYLSSTTTDKFLQNAICLASAKVAIVGTGLARVVSAGYEQQHFASLNIINKASSNNFISDLALVSVEADSSYMTCNTYTLPTTVNVCTSHLRPRIKVKNMGITTIHSFKLNCFYTLSLICGGPIFYHHQFSGLSLQPGDSITLTATSFAPKYLDVVSTPTTNVNYCFYTTLPNGETDKTLADNESCKPFSFVVTSVDDLEKMRQAVNVFPNPFGNSISIESSEIISKVEMTDALGRSVHGFNVNSKQATFDTTNLPAGIYLIKLYTGKGTSVKKVVRN